jgi:hypothetical protein
MNPDAPQVASELIQKASCWSKWLRCGTFKHKAAVFALAVAVRVHAR